MREAHSLNSDAAATPAVDGKGVVVSRTYDGELWVHEYELDGTPGWSRSLGPYSAQHGSGVSPIVVGDVVILGKDHEMEGSALYGIERETGEVRWTRERVSSRASYATPVLLPSEDGATHVVFSSTSHGLTALDPATGEMVWELELGFTQRCVGGPAYTNGYLWQAAGAGGGGRESAVVQLDAEGGPTVVHSGGRALPYVPAPIGHAGMFFACSDGGIFTCRDAQTGELRWQERIENATFFGSPILVGDVLVIVSKEGERIAVRAAAEFDLLDRRSLGEPSFATPAVSDRRMYVRTLGTLMAFELTGSGQGADG